MELDGQENFFVFRAGIGPEFKVGNHWDFAPEIVYDVKDGHINSLTIAIGLGKKDLVNLMRNVLPAKNKIINY